MKFLTSKSILWLAVLLLLAWLFRQSTQVDIAQHLRTVQYFEQLSQQDAKLNQYVLQARYGQLKNYDPIIATQQQIMLVLNSLQQDKYGYFTEGKQRIQQSFMRYRALFQHKSEMIESFKSHNAVLHNSLRYFPFAAKLQIETMQADSRQEKWLHE